MKQVGVLDLMTVAALGCLFLMTACGGNNGGPNVVQCANPILLTDSSMQRAMRTSDLPPGDFKLSSMQVYFVDQATSDSFTASATSMDGFSNVSMDCTGVRNSVKAVAEAASSIDFVGKTNSPDSIQLSFEFDNGKLAFSNAGTGSSVDNGFNSTDSSDAIPSGQVSIGQDQYMQIAVYTPTSTQVDLRMEIESAADGNGNRKLIFVRAGYTKM